MYICILLQAPSIVLNSISQQERNTILSNITFDLGIL